MEPLNRVLVLGATGFVGSRVLTRLARQPGVEVVAACRDAARLPPTFRAQARVGDLRDACYRSRVFYGVDVVCLTAAWSALYGHATESEALYRKPLSDSLDAATRAGVRRIVMTSALQVKCVATSRFAPVRDSLERVWPHLANLLRLERQMQELSSSRTEMVSLRFGTFSGVGQNLGILPVLLPRLRARLVPWIEAGRAPLPLIDVEDVARAFSAAALGQSQQPYDVLEATGPVEPSFREVVTYLHEQFGYPLPFFGVSGHVAFRFGQFAEMLARLVGTSPLLTRSIVFLAEPCAADRSSWSRWSYEPRVRWQDSVEAQVRDLERRRVPPRLVDTVSAPFEGMGS